MPADQPRPTCAPAEGTKEGTWHWLEADQKGKEDPAFILMKWTGRHWRFAEYRTATPQEAAEYGYRYLRPCPTPEELAEREREVERLRAALKAFATEGAKWLATDPGHDDLTLCVSEDWHLVGCVSREAEFTVGDLKRAARSLAALAVAEREGKP